MYSEEKSFTYGFSLKLNDHFLKRKGGKLKLIYFDNSATTYPKPLMVNNAVALSMKKFGANPGRSGHKLSRNSSREVQHCREVASELFGVRSPENVAFTLNCTQALNMVIKGLLKPGDHVVTSCLEHNAVMRPLSKLEKTIGVSYTVAKVYPGDNDKTVDSFRNAINSETKLIICTHASNVLGVKLPVARIAALAHIYKIPILVDGAQSAGIVPIDVQKMGIDFLCLAGHKGLYGPMGTGMLITNKHEMLDTIIEGGTGTDSMKLCQPKIMPQKFESGTPNIPGICGLRAGMEFVKNKGINNIFNHELKLMQYLYDNLKQISSVKLYMPRPHRDYFVPLISFNLRDYISDKVGKFLDVNEIEVRTGLHCAPSAHEFIGTLETGTVRVSPSIFNTKQEVDRFINVIKKI